MQVGYLEKEHAEQKKQEVKGPEGLHHLCWRQSKKVRETRMQGMRENV